MKLQHDEEMASFQQQLKFLQEQNQSMMGQITQGNKYKNLIDHMVDKKVVKWMGNDLELV